MGRVVLYMCISLALFSTCVNSESSLQRLHKDLFEEYMCTVRPVMDVSETIHVDAKYNLQAIVELDERHQTLSTMGWVSLRWTDQFLRWNVTDYDGIKAIFIPQRKIWLPDVAFENSVDSYGHFGYDQLVVKVSSDGATQWDPGFALNSICPVDVSEYPFDYQECHIELTTWMSPEEYVHMTTSSDTIGLDLYKENEEWNARSTSAYGWQSALENLTGISFVINIERRRLFHSLHTILPVVLFSILGCLVFILPAEGADKLGFSITIWLTFTVFLGQISEDMPRTPDIGQSVFGLYLTACFILNVLYVGLSVLILRCYFTPQTTAVWPCAERLVLRMRNISSVLACAHNKDNPESKGNIVSSKPVTWKEFGRLLDRACFIVFMSTTIVACTLLFVVLAL
jgi:hypothetical protein